MFNNLSSLQRKFIRDFIRDCFIFLGLITWLVFGFISVANEWEVCCLIFSLPFFSLALFIIVTDAAKQLLGYGKGDVEDIYDSHKLSNLRYEISTYARSNANSHNGVTFVQGYVPSYKELNPTDIIGNRRTQTVRGNRVLQYDFDGNLIRVFKNAADAAENLGKSTAWVSILCNADFILRYDR